MASFANPEEIACVGRVKNEEDIIYFCLENLYSYGVKQFVIADNDSKDRTKVEIYRFRDDHPDVRLFLVDDFRENMSFNNQSNTQTALSDFAAGIFKAKWIIPIDADDFVYIPGDVTVDLDDFNVDFVQLDWIHVHPIQFQNMSIPEFMQMEPLVGTQSSTKVGKVIFRWHHDIVVETGQHRVYSKTGRILVGMRGKYLGLACAHFPVRSREKFEAKLDNITRHRRTFEHWRRITEAAGGRQKLIEVLWSGNAEDFSAICENLGLPPKNVGYMYDLFVRKEHEVFEPNIVDDPHAFGTPKLYIVGSKDPLQPKSTNTFRSFAVSLRRAANRVSQRIPRLFGV